MSRGKADEGHGAHSSGWVHTPHVCPGGGVGGRSLRAHLLHRAPRGEGVAGVECRARCQAYPRARQSSAGSGGRAGTEQLDGSPPGAAGASQAFRTGCPAGYSPWWQGRALNWEPWGEGGGLRGCGAAGRGRDPGRGSGVAQ